MSQHSNTRFRQTILNVMLIVQEYGRFSGKFGWAQTPLWWIKQLSLKQIKRPLNCFSESSVES